MTRAGWLSAGLICIALLAFVEYQLAAPEEAADGSEFENRRDSIMSVALNVLSVAGNRASFGVNVDASGNVSVIPSAGGTTLSGSQIGVIQFSDVSMYVLNNAEASVALLYEAALGREPDPSGLTTWINAYNAESSSAQAAGVYTSLAGTATIGLPNIAYGFTASSEFQSKYGSLSDAQYITQLYANVLHRAPDSGGMTTWMTALTPIGQSYVDSTGVSHAGLGESREYVLVGFAESSENIADTAAASTTTTTGGWLINTSQGGYADAGTVSFSTVMSQALTSNVFNAALISSSTLPNGIGNVQGNSSFTVQQSFEGGWASSVMAANSTVELSSSVNQLGVYANGVSVVGPAGGNANIDVDHIETVTLVNTGGNNYTSQTSFTPISGTQITLAGSANQVEIYHRAGVADATNTTITGWVIGSDAISLPTTFAFYESHASNNISVITSGSGAALNFTTTSYVLNVGAVGGGSAAEVATAANAVYTVGDVNGHAASYGLSQFGENLTIIGTTSAGNTVLYEWVNWSDVGGFQVPLNSPDTAGTHTITAAELTQLVTLVGVHASQLTAADFHVSGSSG